MSLPTDDKLRKAIPIFDGLLMYFPDACMAVAEVSRIGNEQHNPGEPLHWARGKSMDQFNTALRHLMDHKLGVRADVDNARHLAKAAWRVLAALQLDIEAERLEALSGPMGRVEPAPAPFDPFAWFEGTGSRPSWIGENDTVAVRPQGAKSDGRMHPAHRLSWVSDTDYRLVRPT